MSASQIYLDNGVYRIVPFPPDADKYLQAGWELIDKRVCTTNIEVVAEYEHMFSAQLRFELGLELQSSAMLSTETIKPKMRLSIAATKPLRWFQDESINFIVQRAYTGGVVLGDVPGAGKTASVISAINELSFVESIFVSTTATAKYGLITEFRDWCLFSFTAIVYSGTKKKPRQDEYRYTPPQHDLPLEMRGKELRHVTIHIYNHDIIREWHEEIRERRYDVMFVDEVHKMKNHKSARTIHLFGGKVGKTIIPRIEATLPIFATGTLLDKNKNLWVLNKRIDPQGLGRDYFKFITRYCNAFRTPYGWDDNGSTNTAELRQLMSKFLIRHDESCLNLPPCTEQTIILPPNSAIKTAEQELFAAFLGDDDATPEDITQARFLIEDSFIEQGAAIKGSKSKVLFELIAKLRLMTGVAKIKPAIEHIRDVLEDENLVVFAYHTDVIDAIQEAFPDISVVVKGGVSPKKRTELVKQFQSGEKRLFIGNIGAAAEAITLTKAKRLFFVELDWNATSMEQARKRVDRLSQMHKVLIEYMTQDESLDFNLSRAYIAKRKTGKEFYAADISAKDAPQIIPQGITGS